MPPGAQPIARDPFVRFITVGVALYAGWYLLYEFLIHPWGRIDKAVIDNIMWLSGGMLEALGYTLLPEPAFDNNRYLGIDGGSHLWIGDPCNGVSLFAVFTIFILAYPGPWKHKAWYIGAGVLSIHLINNLRVVALCIINKVDYSLLNFQHDYTFYVVVYGWVFLLWYLWVKRFGPSIPRSRPAP